MPSPSVAAVFDFDETLTERDSLLPFLYHVAGPWAFVWNVVVLVPVLVQYALGWMSNGTAKAAVFEQFLQGRCVETVKEHARTFASSTLPRFHRADAINRLRWHQSQGHRIVLASASVSLYLGPWAEAMGFDDVLCTRLETRQGRFTGRLDGENCHGPEKVRRLRTAIPEIDDLLVYAYGDSVGDRELLALADHAYYRTFEVSSSFPSSGHSKSDVGEDGEPSQVSGRTFRLLLVAAICTVALYGGFAVWSGTVETWGALRSMRGSTIVVLLGIVCAGYLSRFVRWHWYLRRLGFFVPWGDSLRVFLTSFALTTTPGKAGESVKSLLLKRSHGIPAASTLGVLVAERFTDLLSVVLVVGIGLTMLAQGQWIVLAIGVVQVGAIGILLRPQWVRRALFLPLARRASHRRWVRPVDTLFEGAQRLLHPRHLGGGLLLGGLPWIGEGVAMWILFQALGVEAIGLYEAILIHAAATLFGAVTFLPGGIGGHEAVSIALAMAYGAARPDAVAATVLIRLLTLWFAVALGLGTAATTILRPLPLQGDESKTSRPSFSVERAG